MDELTKLRQERTELLRKMKAALDRANGRSMSDREERWYAGCERDVKVIDGKLAELERKRELARRGLGPDPGANYDDGFYPGRLMGDPDDYRDEFESAVVLGPEQRVADWARGRGGGRLSEVVADHSGERFSLGRAIRGAVTGNWRGAEFEQRVMAEGVGSAGGFLIPEPLSPRFIDRIRNATRAIQAGVQTVPMTVDTLSIARLTGGASVAWKLENDPIVASDMTFDRVTFTSRTLPVLVRMSQELFEDLTPEATDGIETEMAQALGLELDRVILRGSGVAPEPDGIRNQSGVTITALGAGNGATPTWDNLIDAAHTVRNANGEPSAIVWAPRTAQTLSKVKDSTGQYLTPPAALDGMPKLSTNQIPVSLTVGSSSDCSEIYVADFRQVLLGLRTDLRFQIRTLTERYADNLQVGLLTYLRADVQIAHPELVTVLTGVRP